MDRPPSSPGPRPRRRDRHGRGLRGPLAPPQVPISLTRAQVFDDYVRDSVDRLERRWPQLGGVEFAVQEVPPPPAGTSAGGEPPEDAVPLGRVVPAAQGRPTRIVVYRRPVEIRARGQEERAALVHDVVVEQVAELLGMSPEAVDPGYGED